MKANAVPLLAIFEKKMRLEVPLFQRQYVWSRAQQWEPLWEDISRKFTEYLEGRKEAPVHFLGAMVLDQKETPTTHVEKRQVIDGQQRLTTLNIFLAALRDFCRENGCDNLGRETERFTLNDGMMADREVDKFKVWPTQLDRPQFMDVIMGGSRSAIESKHPLVRRKYAKKFDPRPKMVEAYLFFYDSLHAFFNGTAEDEPLAAESPIAARLEECFQALKNALHVVVIDLEPGDDAQVIFETLNSRGEPLLPADLLRNYVFLRAGRLKEPQEALYQKYWSKFDDPFWRQEVRQGRLNRPRSDLFMQHFLTSRQFVDIPINHLFVEYRFWIENEHPFKTVAEELACLSRQGDDFRRIVEPKKGDVICPLVTFLESFDVRTAYPLLLLLLDSGLTEEQWSSVAADLESFLLRRAFLGWSTKAYNRIFLNLAKNLKKNGPSVENLRNGLSLLSGETSAWPTDDQFYAAWQSSHAYHLLNNAKIVHILKRLSNAMLTSKNESISIDGALTVEHIMPQKWIAHWPLADGSKGLTDFELYDAASGDKVAAATRMRNSALQTIGNLTLITQPLNSATSNAAWTTKKTRLLESSLLPINQRLHSVTVWDDDAIAQRGRELFKLAKTIWPAPNLTLPRNAPPTA